MKEGADAWLVPHGGARGHEGEALYGADAGVVCALRIGGHGRSDPRSHTGVAVIVGWALLGLIVVVLVAAVVRGVVRAARVSIRQDLVSLGEMQQLAGALAQMTTTAYAFAAPLLKERESSVGWLWWRTRMGPDGKAERDMGWAMTYRRARKAAGAPLDWRLVSGSEVVVVPTDARFPAVEGRNGAPSSEC
ncbi:hypothetical protein AB0C93_11385 [Streptomyces sp. NPDC048518]|uniref:hypothetical protein n=1 Tax=Streptomyces sp. NPDC048518 TaxID=3155029 RepID=UPI0033F31B0B